MRVAAFTKYSREAASTRQRFLQYSPALEAAGIELNIYPLFNDAYVRGLATGNRPPLNSLARAYAQRLVQVSRMGSYDLIWLYADLFPYLPGLLDRQIFRRGIPVVYDWDDAFHVPYQYSRNPIVRVLFHNKIDRLIAGAAAATCGNEYLRDYAARFCSKSIVLPTVVNTEVYRPIERQRGNPPIIGWMGSPTTWINVRSILPLLKELCASGRARITVVGAGQAALQDRFPGIEFVDWSEATEVTDVQNFDIGIMPLLDEPFQRGKSGYKLIQYMACGVPAVGSPVGVNRKILESGGGLVAANEDEWKSALIGLIEDPELCHRIGSCGRELTLESYSLASQTGHLISLFKSLAPSRF